MENDLEKVLEKKFYCPSRFTQEIENVVLDNEDMSYIDAVVFFASRIILMLSLFQNLSLNL